MGTLWQDIRYGLRMHGRAPGLTAIAVLSLALGIGINTTIFASLKSFMFIMPPVRDPGQIAIVWATQLRSGIERSPASLLDFQAVRERNTSFQGVAVWADSEFRLRGEGASVSVSGMRVSADFFPLMGVAPLQGRVIQTGDDVPGAEPVAVIGYRLWQRSLGADPKILGRSIWLDKRSFTVVGVMPQGFWFQYQVDAWIPLTIAPADAQIPRRNLRIVARLKDAVSIQQARAEMDALAASLEREYPATNTGWGLHPILVREEATKRAGFGIAFLFLPVLFVLLIACGNVTNLLLARASARRQEMAMRATLGAGRLQIIKQLLTESALWSLLAGVLGILLAYWGLHLFRTIVLAHAPDAAESMRMDLGVFLFALFLCLATPLMFGLAPALEASRIDLAEALKSGGQGMGGTRKQRRQREVLVLAEVALVVVMLVPTGLLLRAMLRLGQINLGFEANHLLTMPIPLVAEEYAAEQGAPAFVRSLVERVAATPGVQAAAVSDTFPAFFGAQPAADSITLEEMPGQAARAGLSVRRTNISTKCFAALGVPVLRGRDFAEADFADWAPGVAIVSDVAARRFWPNRDPLGQRFRFAGSGDAAGWLTVVGVVAHILPSMPGVSTPPENQLRPQVYLPLRPGNQRSLYLLLRTKTPPAGLLPALRSAIRSVDTRLPVDELRTVQQSFDAQASQGNTMVGMLGVFATLALALAAIGVFGVLSYLASQRTHEIGVRIALGARRHQIFQLVLLQGLRPVLIGLFVGYAGGYALSLMLAREIGQFGIKPTDVATFSACALVILSVAFLACLIPARRATQVDPMTALRCE